MSMRKDIILSINGLKMDRLFNQDPLQNTVFQVQQSMIQAIIVLKYPVPAVPY